MKLKACIPCTKAKRKCGRELPQCLRCEVKGIECSYPPRRTTRIPQSASQSRSGDSSGNGASLAAAAYDTNPNQDTYDSAYMNIDAMVTGDVLSENRLIGGGGGIAPGGRQETEPWYLSPESWSVYHGPLMPLEPQFGETTLHLFISEIKSWLKRWVSGDNNPLFHPQLYQNDLPAVIQDAYTSVTTYLSQTPANKSVINRIIDARADSLLRQYQSPAAGAAESAEGGFSGGPAGVGGLDPSSLDVVLLDTISHLARTQALMVYQIVRLFDGDIRLRAKAEASTETMQLWARQMLENASLSVQLVDSTSTHQPAPVPGGDNDLSALPPHLAVLNAQNRSVGSGSPFSRDGSPRSEWYAWLVSESIRRTYFASTYVQTVYGTLKQIWWPCPGGLSITLWKALWDANSPYQWQVALRARGTDPLRSWECDRLSSGGYAASDVDEFAKLVFLIHQGMEAREQWVADGK